MVFILLSVFGGIAFLVFWPDTRNMPLEEISAIFGDEDEVAVHQRELEIEPSTHAVHDRQASMTIDSGKGKVLELSELAHVEV